jgi:hypothetical protein
MWWVHSIELHGEQQEEVHQVCSNPSKPLVNGLSRACWASRIFNRRTTGAKLVGTKEWVESIILHKKS